MGIPQKTIETITADEYLSLERQAEERNEFYQGECMAMAGGSRWLRFFGAEKNTNGNMSG